MDGLIVTIQEVSMLYLPFLIIEEPYQSLVTHTLQISLVLYSPSTAINRRTDAFLTVDSPCRPVLEVWEIGKQVAHLYHFVCLHTQSLLLLLQQNCLL